MVKRRYNWKAREVVNTLIDNSETKKIQVDLEGGFQYDVNNQLVLPSKKRKTKKINDNNQITRILSNKQRKNLEKIVQKKKKKEHRATLFESLQQFKASNDELSKMTSITSIQTKGLKRHFFEEANPDKVKPKRITDISNVPFKINTIKGSKRRKLIQGNNEHKRGNIAYDRNDPNIVGFESSSSDDSETEDELPIVGSSENNEVKQEEVADRTEDVNWDFTIVEAKKEVSHIEIKDDVDDWEATVVEKKEQVLPIEVKHDVSAWEVNVVEEKEGPHKEIKFDVRDWKVHIVKGKEAAPSLEFKDEVGEWEVNIVEETKEVPPIEIKDDDREVNVVEKNKDVPPIEIKDHCNKLQSAKPAVFVPVLRNNEIQESRLKLPILSEEQQIMEKINENSIVLIAGETGCGKTTQVPQFLYEAGYALKKQIAVTEPRRIAAISMSNRVAEEMNLSSREVSYLIRFEGNTTEDTKIVFMTDGVLFKEIQKDFLLSKYSVVILDEAHERSAYTDILIGFLSRIVPLRIKKGDPLKLIIMSATLRIEDFVFNERLFKNSPPVIEIETRQFPVTVHFNRRTNENYLKEAFSKAVKINTKLPEGGILIFVTGQQEVNSLVRKLRKTFPLRHKSKILEKSQAVNEDKDDSDFDDDVEEGMMKALRIRRKMKIVPKFYLDDYSIPGDIETSDVDDFSEEEDYEFSSEINAITNAQPLWTLPLYSLLPTHKQKKVFQPPPPGCRLCIVSTNVAETSLTIPNIKYVIDTGKTKVKLYDKVTGVNRFVVDWTSKASANQRAGRAGRLGPGHCYRLYSSAVFNDIFQEYAIPEIQQKPVDDIYLQLRCMRISKVLNFPFPTTPDLKQLETAEYRLETLGALKEGKVTQLGRVISMFPVLPRYGKMLALSNQHGMLPYTICLVAALSVPEVLLEVPIDSRSVVEKEEIRRKWAAIRYKWAREGNFHLLGDNMVLLTAVGAAEYAFSQSKLEQFCLKNGLRQKAIAEIRKLRLQLTNDFKKNIPEVDIVVDPKLSPPTDLQASLLRQMILSGMGDHVAKKISPDDVKTGRNKVDLRYAYNANNMEDPVFLHQSSVLWKTLPEFVVYQEIYESNKMYMRGVTAIEPEWLATYVPTLCNLSKPLLDPEPIYKPETGKVYCTVTGTFGPQAWPLPNSEIVYPISVDAFRWFARYFLEGVVFPKLKKYAGVLKIRPQTMVKSWAKLQPLTQLMLKVLLSRDCCSKQSLVEVWKNSPHFLLDVYLQCLPESAHGEVSLLWPPLD